MIDIHSHTTYSDGSFTVEEILKEAAKVGLSLLSVTDHNTVNAYDEITSNKLRNIFKGNIIPGVEITTTYKGEIVEVLGYGFDIKKMKELLQQNVLTFEDKQLKEYELIKNRYKEIGVKFDEQNIKFNPKKESCRLSLVNEIKKYPENYQFFLYQESIDTLAGFSRNEVFNPKSPLYVEQSLLFPSFEKTVEIIHEAGGLAFFAHTYAYSENIAKEILNIIDKYDLDGLECFYTTFTEEQSNYLVNLCKERDLLMSGGSDFHGARKINHSLGTGNGNLNIAEDIVSKWIKNII